MLLVRSRRRFEEGGRERRRLIVNQPAIVKRVGYTRGIDGYASRRRSFGLYTTHLGWGTNYDAAELLVEFRVVPNAGSREPQHPVCEDIGNQGMLILPREIACLRRKSLWASRERIVGLPSVNLYRYLFAEAVPTSQADPRMMVFRISISDFVLLPRSV